MRLLVALVVSAGVFPAVVSAQPAPTAASSPGPLPDRPLPPPPHVVPPPAPRRLPVFSATITPFALPWEIFELTVPGGFPIVALSFELRAHPRLGIAVMGLGGEQTNSDINFKRHDTFFEWGVEPRFYLLGGFRGLMVGAALHWFR